MDKQIVGYFHDSTLLRVGKKKKTTNKHINIDVSQKYDVKQKEPDEKEEMVSIK